MIWPFLPLLLAYAIGIWVVLCLGASIVGESRAGRAALPVAAVVWPVAMWLLIVIGIVAAINAAFDEAIAWTCERPLQQAQDERS